MTNLYLSSDIESQFESIYADVLRGVDTNNPELLFINSNFKSNKIKLFNSINKLLRRIKSDEVFKALQVFKYNCNDYLQMLHASRTQEPLLC